MIPCASFSLKSFFFVSHRFFQISFISGKFWKLWLSFCYFSLLKFVFFISITDFTKGNLFLIAIIAYPIKCVQMKYHFSRYYPHLTIGGVNYRIFISFFSSDFYLLPPPPQFVKISKNPTPLVIVNPPNLPYLFFYRK